MIAVGQDFGIWLTAAALLGLGTAMVYPTLLAAIGDVAHPEWRARSVGIYRLWRDGGFAVGALLSGIIADAYGIPAAVGVVGALTALSGILVAVRMRGTDHHRTRLTRRRNPPELAIAIFGGKVQYQVSPAPSPRQEIMMSDFASLAPALTGI